MIKQFYMPTKVVMGENCISLNSDLIAGMGTKALIVTGAHSAKANGALEDVINVLKSNSQSYAVFDRVMANPTVECAYEGATFASENEVDFIIAIGGGSPMDAAKAMALLAKQNVPEEKLFSGDYINCVLPIAAIPTTAGTGSEVTQYSILTNHKAQTKTSIASAILFPKLAFLDARYMKGLSYTTTINTAIDALSHSIEGMLSIRASSVTDSLAQESIRLIASCFTGLKQCTLTQEQRFDLLKASMLGGMVIANTGTTAVHAMGYSLTYFKDIDHGRANGLLLAEFMRFVEDIFPKRIQSILCQMQMRTVDEFSKILNGLLGDRETLKRDEIEKYTQLAMKTKNIANCIITPEESDLNSIFKDSFNISGEVDFY